MASTAAETTPTPWADSPIELVHTPQFQTNKTDLFTIGATHMCLLHNAILRGYNSIYQQAAGVVDDVDKADFVGYCQTWVKFVKSHHDDEETVLFPQVEALLDDTSIWETTHEEHEAMLSGVVAFQDYLAGLSSPADFSGEKLLQIMASFQAPFSNHFHSEVATIAALADHPKAPAPNTAAAANAAATFKSWGKSTVTKAGILDVVPFFLLNLDRSRGFEDGLWANWPPMPAPIRWGMTNIAGSWHGSWWRFSSCDAAGQPQTLWVLKQLSAAKKPAAAKEEL